jgi:UrcA family protein
MKTLSTLIFGIAFTLSMLTASAGDTIVTKSQVVRFSDLNLSSDDGVRTLYQRMRGAARLVCADADRSLRLEQPNYQTCFKKAVGDAVSQVNQPALTAMHRSGTSSSNG